MKYLNSTFVMNALDDAGIFHGIASTASMNRNEWAYAPDAFKVSLAEHAKRGTMPALLMHHDRTRPAGVWTKIEPTAKGLKVSGKLTLDAADGAEAYSLLKSGALSSLSTGAIHRQMGPVKTGGNLVTEADLYEISLVSVPANPDARVLRVSAIDGVRDIEQLLRQANVSSRRAKVAAAAAWRALQSSPAPSGDKLASILGAANTSLARFKRSNDQ